MVVVQVGVGVIVYLNFAIFPLLLVKETLMFDADLWTGADQWSIICWPQNYIERHSVHFYPFWEMLLSKNINQSWASKIYNLRDLVQRVPERVDSLY